MHYQIYLYFILTLFQVILGAGSFLWFSPTFMESSKGILPIFECAVIRVLDSLSCSYRWTPVIYVFSDVWSFPCCASRGRGCLSAILTATFPANTSLSVITALTHIILCCLIVTGAYNNDLFLLSKRRCNKSSNRNLAGLGPFYEYKIYYLRLKAKDEKQAS
jgi:hypothetical protein